MSEHNSKLAKNSQKNNFDRQQENISGLQSPENKSTKKKSDANLQFVQGDKKSQLKQSLAQPKKQASVPMSQREWNAVYHNKSYDINLEKKEGQQKIQSKTNKNLAQKVQVVNKNQQKIVYWETAYIDQKFYLSDPESLAKLRQLDHQIFIQRQKLTQIQATQNFDHSFLSQRDMEEDNPDNYKMECLTEINESKLLQRKKYAQQDLLCLQQKYQAKIQQIKKKKSILKKQIGCGTNDKNLQINQQQLIKQRKQIQKAAQIKQQATHHEKNNRIEIGKSQNQIVKSQIKASKVNQKTNQRKLEEKQPSKSKKKMHQKQEDIQKSKNIKQSSTEKEFIKKEKSHRSTLEQKEKSYKPVQIEKSLKPIQLEKQKSHRSTLKQKEKIQNPAEVEKSYKPVQVEKSVKRVQVQKQKSHKQSEVEKSYKNLQVQKQRSHKKAEIQNQKSHKSVFLQKDKSHKPVEIVKQKSYKQVEVQMEKSHKGGAQMQKSKKPSEVQKQKSHRSALIQKQKSQKSAQVEKQKSHKQVEVQKQKSYKLVQVEKSHKPTEEKQKSHKPAQLQKQKSNRSEFIQKQKSRKPAQVEKQKSQKSSYVEKQRSHKPALDQKQKSQKPQSREKQKSHKSVLEENQKSHKQALGEKQKSHKPSISQKNSQNSHHTSNQASNFIPPQIKIHQASFKKTDKSVQWQQIQPSVQQFNANRSISGSALKESSIYQNPSQNVNQSNIEQNNYQQKNYSGKKSQKSNLHSQISDRKMGSSKVSQRITQRKQLINNSEVKVQNRSNKPKAISQNVSKMHEQQVQKKQPQQELAQSSVLQKQEMKSQSAVMSQSHISSDKRKTSFKIHSRQKSIKSKNSVSQNPSAQKNNPQSQLKSSKYFSKQSQDGNNYSQAKINKEEFQRLHLQIQQLQQKLKRVQQKQQQIIKFQNNPLKMMNELEASQAGSGSEPASPLGKMSLTSRLKLQAKLSLESTVQFNTFQQKMKKTAQQNQKLQKLRLQQEIGRLKKIIRQMQMQKIKSIQYEQGSSQSKVQLRKPSILDQQENNQSRISQKWKDSLNSDFLQTKKNEWNTQTMNRDVKFDTGKIIKNSAKKYHLDSPKKYNRLNAQKSKQFSEVAKDEQNGQAPLPLRKKAQSVHDRKSRDLTKSELINKFEQSDKNFHQFLQASRLVKQPESYIDANHSLPQAFEHKNQAKLIQNKQYDSSPEDKRTVNRNYSELLQKLKNQNPQDQIITPPVISINNINLPNLPEAPNLNNTQEDLLQIAKKTYKLFGIQVQQDQNQLCMKKYKNCVMFTFGNNQQQSILWHYSGKFYFGGWKNLNDQGQGQKIGEGLQYIPGKHLYQGQFLAGKKNGNGIVKMANGNIYDGQWIDGTKNGRGVYFQASTGTYYSGEWKDGKREGYGILKFSNNQFYEGTFFKSIKHGYGVEKFGNNDFYKGEYQKGKFHGKGKYSWSNGSSYEGDFLQGLRHGQGSWKSSRKGGDIYIGGYENDKKCGYGRYVWANGCVYEGQFKNDLKNGKGRLVYQDGKQIKGFWQDGNLVSSDNDAKKIQDHQQEPLRRSIRASSLKNNPNPASPYRLPAYK